MSCKKLVPPCPDQCSTIPEKVRKDGKTVKAHCRSKERKVQEKPKKKSIPKKIVDVVKENKVRSETSSGCRLKDVLPKEFLKNTKVGNYKLNEIFPTKEEQYKVLSNQETTKQLVEELAGSQKNFNTKLKNLNEAKSLLDNTVEETGETKLSEIFTNPKEAEEVIKNQGKLKNLIQELDSYYIQQKLKKKNTTLKEVIPKEQLKNHKKKVQNMKVIEVLGENPEEILKDKTEVQKILVVEDSKTKQFKMTDTLDSIVPAEYFESKPETGKLTFEDIFSSKTDAQEFVDDSDNWDEYIEEFDRDYNTYIEERENRVKFTMETRLDEVFPEEYFDTAPDMGNIRFKYVFQTKEEANEIVENKDLWPAFFKDLEQQYAKSMQEQELKKLGQQQEFIKYLESKDKNTVIYTFPGSQIWHADNINNISKGERKDLEANGVKLINFNNGSLSDVTGIPADKDTKISDKYKNAYEFMLKKNPKEPEERKAMREQVEKLKEKIKNQEEEEEKEEEPKNKRKPKKPKKMSV
jgi:hypothetical protein